MATTKPKIHFSVEQAEAERAVDRKEPFTADILGRTITMTDAQDVDWKVLAEMESPIEFIRYCASEEDRDYLREAPLSGAVFGKLIEAYMAHYGLGDKGKGAGLRF